MMARPFNIAIIVWMVLALAGCDQPEKTEPIWEKVKITDIAPYDTSKSTPVVLLSTINFSVYVFEIPAENIGRLDDIRQMLFAGQIRFRDQRAFKANLFSIGFGDVRMFGKIIELFRAAGSKKTIDRVSLLLRDGQPDDLSIVNLYKKQTILYSSVRGSMQEVTVGPGTMALRVTANKAFGSTGLCNVTVQPVFLPPSPGFFLQTVPRARSGELLFNTAKFQLRMSPGDLFVLAPEKYAESQVTLGSLFFNIAGPTPTVRAFLFICTDIID